MDDDERINLYFATDGARLDDPDYVVCIASTHADMAGLALCQKPVVGFVFQGVDHWFLNRVQHGRLIGCPSCVELVSGCVHEEAGPTGCIAEGCYVAFRDGDLGRGWLHISVRGAHGEAVVRLCPDHTDRADWAATVAAKEAIAATYVHR